MNDRQKDILAWQTACELNPGLVARLRECWEMSEHPNCFAARRTYRNQLAEAARIIRKTIP